MEDTRRIWDTLSFSFFLVGAEVQRGGCTPFVIDGAVILADRLVQLHTAPFTRGEFRGALISEHAGFAALARRHYHPVTYPQLAPLRRGRQASRRCICIHSFQRCAIIITYYSHRVRNHERVGSILLKLNYFVFFFYDDETRVYLGFYTRVKFIFSNAVKVKSNYI